MDDRKRIYIAGCGGMLGDAFYNEFKDDYILREIIQEYASGD